MASMSEHVLSISNGFNVLNVSTGCVHFFQLRNGTNRRRKKISFDFKTELIESNSFYTVKSTVTNTSFLLISAVFRLVQGEISAEYTILDSDNSKSKQKSFSNLLDF